LTFLKTEKASFRKDRSNREERFMRNWLRQRIFPLIELRSPGFKSRVAHLAALFRDDADFWNGFLEKMETTVLRPYHGGRLLDFKGLLSYPPAVQNRFFRRVVGPQILTFE